MRTVETPALAYWRTLCEEIETLGGDLIAFDAAYTHWENRTAPHDAAHQIVGAQELARMLANDQVERDYAAAYARNKDACNFLADK